MCVCANFVREIRGRRRFEGELAVVRSLINGPTHLHSGFCRPCEKEKREGVKRA